jgi:DNA-binding PadR family transcriptional regulator
MYPFAQRIQKILHRHHHHTAGGAFRGFGGFSGRHGSGSDQFSGDFGGLRRGRKLGSSDLQLILLAFLAERASHGYELIKSLEQRSHGYYVPSPGMIYPALIYLEEIGHARVQALGAKKLYSITDAGLTHLERHRATVDALLEQLAWIGKRMDHLRRAIAGAGEPGDDADFDSPHVFSGRPAGRHSEGTREVRIARRSLKSALIEKTGASGTEQRRIAKILERAATEIRGDKSSD